MTTLDLAQSWLNTQCSLIPGAERGVVVRLPVGDEDAPAVAVWPADEGEPIAELLATARRAASLRSVAVGAAAPDGQDPGSAPGANGEATPISVLGCPLFNTAGQFGAVALAVRGHAGGQQQAVLKLLRWGAAWFDLMGRSAAPDAKDRLIRVVEILASAMEHENSSAAATAAANEIAERLGCARVSIGVLKGRDLVIHAMSHSASVEQRSNLVRDIRAAMHEALDQDASVICPPVPGAPPRVVFAQENLFERNNGGPVCSTPLYNANTAIGAITLEWETREAFDPGAVELIESFAALFGPVLQLKRDHERPIVHKVFDSLRAAVWRVIGPRHFVTKLTVLTLICVSAFLWTATGNYTVSAEATIEGRVKRVVVAPQDGYVATAEVRAGDTVVAGQLLATLDDRDLQLERVKLQSEFEQLQKEQRAAFGARDRSSAAILRAQMRQAQAGLDLVDARLNRTRMTAPFAGVVVSGDLSQRLGAPVKQGDALFEIAPLDAYRVVLDVDERDIGEVEDKATGRLALTGIPDSELTLAVNRILPVSVPRDGGNYFKVEAFLDGGTTPLRPGMQGVAKLAVEERNLAWIWGHTLVEWMRLQLWRWTG